MSASIVLATWNVEWATPRKREAIRKRIVGWDADIVVVTEGDHGVLPDGGYSYDGGSDWGYRVSKPERRKVLLWSRWPVSEVVICQSPSQVVRSGRLIDARVQTPGGLLRVLAVCIPWRDAHVRTGIDPHGVPWREHRRYLDYLGSLIAGHPRDIPLVVMGDFNQRLPRSRQPHDVHEHLRSALGPLEVATAGASPLAGLNRQEVDHIALSHHFDVRRVWGVDRHDGDRRLSDHDAVLAEVTLR